MVGISAVLGIAAVAFGISEEGDAVGLGQPGKSPIDTRKVLDVGSRETWITNPVPAVKPVRNGGPLRRSQFSVCSSRLLWLEIAPVV